MKRWMLVFMFPGLVASAMASVWNCEKKLLPNFVISESPEYQTFTKDLEDALKNSPQQWPALGSAVTLSSILAYPNFRLTILKELMTDFYYARLPADYQLLFLAHAFAKPLVHVAFVLPNKEVDVGVKLLNDAEAAYLKDLSSWLLELSEKYRFDETQKNRLAELLLSFFKGVDERKFYTWTTTSRKNLGTVYEGDNPQKLNFRDSNNPFQGFDHDAHQISQDLLVALGGRATPGVKANSPLNEASLLVWQQIFGEQAETSLSIKTEEALVSEVDEFLQRLQPSAATLAADPAFLKKLLQKTFVLHPIRISQIVKIWDRLRLLVLPFGVEEKTVEDIQKLLRSYPKKWKSTEAGAFIEEFLERPWREDKESRP